MKENIKVGQVLYRKEKMRSGDSYINEDVVEEIGKKYLYLKGWGKRFPVNKATLICENKIYPQASFQFYLTKEEIYENDARIELHRMVKNHFYYNNNPNTYTLEQLRQVADILGIKKIN